MPLLQMLWLASAHQRLASCHSPSCAWYSRKGEEKSDTFFLESIRAISLCTCSFLCTREAHKKCSQGSVSFVAASALAAHPVVLLKQADDAAVSQDQVRPSPTVPRRSTTDAPTPAAAPSMRRTSSLLSRFTTFRRTQDDHAKQVLKNVSQIRNLGPLPPGKQAHKQWIVAGAPIARSSHPWLQQIDAAACLGPSSLPCQYRARAKSELNIVLPSRKLDAMMCCGFHDQFCLYIFYPKLEALPASCLVRLACHAALNSSMRCFDQELDGRTKRTIKKGTIQVRLLGTTWQSPAPVCTIMIL